MDHPSMLNAALSATHNNDRAFHLFPFSVKSRGCSCTRRPPFAAMAAIGSSMTTDSSSIRHKLIAFDAAVWQALHHLSLDSAKSVQQLADEAFRDLLKKHRRPITLSEALKESVRMQPANDQPLHQPRAAPRHK
jgi:hypothetical protein